MNLEMEPERDRKQASNWPIITGGTDRGALDAVTATIPENEPVTLADSGVRREWATLELSDGESKRLTAAAMKSIVDPLVDPAGFRREAHRGWSALSAGTIAQIEQFAQGKTSRPELYVTNLPVDSTLPPTPLTGQSASISTNTLGEFLMVTFSLALGLPISYRDQRAGRLVHDVYPTRKNAQQVSSQSSSVSLGFHTEMFFHPVPPEFLILHCLRADPAGSAATSIASLDDIKSRLTNQEIAVLNTPSFAMDLARLHGIYQYDGREIRRNDPRPVIPVMNESSAGVQFRFEPELTTPIDDEARQAMAAAERAAEETAIVGKLGLGGMLLLDNRRAVHSRSSFKANFDGHDRWLRRMMVGTHPLDSSPDSVHTTGFHNRPDLELARAWQRSGAAMHVIPYPSGISTGQFPDEISDAANQKMEGN